MDWKAFTFFLDFYGCLKKSCCRDFRNLQKYAILRRFQTKKLKKTISQQTIMTANIRQE